jgi:hypothetical protein
MMISKLQLEEKRILEGESEERYDCLPFPLLLERIQRRGRDFEVT